MTKPQIGGAKAGIRFDHRDARANGVLRRFINDNRVLLANSWVSIPLSRFGVHFD